MAKQISCMLFLAAALIMAAPAAFESDVFQTAAGELRLTFIGHASLLFQFTGKSIYVDPDGRIADFSSLPKADLILITHQHGDHCDPKAIETLRQPSTRVISTMACPQPFAGASTMGNGDKTQFAGIAIEAVPAYNIVHKRANGQPFHPRGEGNGYLLDFPGCRVYIAGDTENIPEMTRLRDIAVAFLPMNLPYTMTPEMTAAAARIIMPRVLYPYHYSDTDPQLLVSALRDVPGIDVRIRKLR